MSAIVSISKQKDDLELNALQKGEPIPSKIQEFGQMLLADLATRPVCVRLPFITQDNRHAFLTWFKNNPLLQVKLASLIATSFGVEDLIFLGKKGELLDWIVTCLEMLQAKQITQEGPQGGYQSHIGSFIGRALGYLEKENIPCEIEKLADVLSAESLELFLEVFPSRYQACVLKKILATAPEKMVAWFELLVKGSRQRYEAVSKSVADLYAKLDPEAIVPHIQEPRLLLTLYASLRTDDKKGLLRELLKNRQKALEIFVGWTTLAPTMAPFVRDLFAANFYDLLLAEDEALMQELASKLATYPDLQELFPIGRDLKSAAGRQEWAIQQLKRHFLTPGISYRDRAQFFEAIHQDLKGTGSDRAMVYFLSERLPKETFPLLFTHCGSYLCERQYDDYLESHSKGGVFRRVRKTEAPTTRISSSQNIIREESERKADEVEKKTSPPTDADAYRVWMWKSLANIDDFFSEHSPREKDMEHDPARLIALSAMMLDQLVDNPLLASDEDLHQVQMGLQHLYQAACETNTIYPIIRRLGEICPHSRLLETLNYFGSSCFKTDQEGFVDLAAEVLQPNKIDTLAKLLLAQYQRPQKHHALTLTHLFWHDTVLKDDAETASLAKKFVELLQENFIELFFQHQESNEWMIDALAKTDREFCQELFFRSFKAFAKCGKEPKTKLAAFLHFCACFQKAGMRLSQLLPSETISEELKTMKSCFTKETVIACVGANQIAWFVLDKIIPELYDQALLYKIESSSLTSFTSLMQALVTGGLSTLYVKHLLNQHPATREKLSALLKGDISGAIKEPSFFYLTDYVPDWKDRLFTWVNDNFATQRYFFSDTMQRLKKLGRYDEWLQHILPQRSSDLEKALSRLE